MYTFGICAKKKSQTIFRNIRQILHHLYIEVEKKAPAHKTLVIGSFIFLRWICPVVLSPDAFGFLSGVFPPFLLRSTDYMQKSLVIKGNALYLWLI